MPNTSAAKKALRNSLRKRQYNTVWRERIKASIKTLKNNLQTKNPDIDILNKELVVLQKVLDKAAKNNVIHKNKANRLKSRYANRIAAQTKSNKKPAKKASSEKPKSKSGKKASTKKSKSKS